jgi:hypothetical protein
MGYALNKWVIILKLATFELDTIKTIMTAFSENLP